MANEIDRDWLNRLVDAVEAEFIASNAMFDAYMKSLKNIGFGAWLTGAKESGAAEVIRLSGEQTKAQRALVAVIAEKVGKPVEPQDELKGLFVTGALNE